MFLNYMILYDASEALVVFGIDHQKLRHHYSPLAMHYIPEELVWIDLQEW